MDRSTAAALAFIAALSASSLAPAAERGTSATAAQSSNPFCAGLYLAPAVLSDYRFDGFSESNRAPTWQVIAHCYRTDGFYAGVQATGVNFLDTPRTRVGLDLYGGKHLRLGPSDLNLQLLYTSFPGKAAPGPTYNMVQGQAELSRPVGRWNFRSSVAFSPNYSGQTGMAWHLKEAVEVQATSWRTASARVGRLWIERGEDRSHFDVGLTARWRRVTVDALYGGTDLRRTQCFGLDWCAPGPSVSLSYRLLP